MIRTTLALLTLVAALGCSGGETVSGNEGISSEIKGSLVNGPSGGKNADATGRKADAAPN